MNLKETFNSNGMHEINNNNKSNGNGFLKKPSHSVRFLSDDRNKGKLKSTVALAESEESIISESSNERYAPTSGFFEHVRWVKFC